MRIEKQSNRLIIEVAIATQDSFWYFVGGSVSLVMGGAIAVGGYPIGLILVISGIMLAFLSLKESTEVSDIYVFDRQAQKLYTRQGHTIPFATIQVQTQTTTPRRTNDETQRDYWVIISTGTTHNFKLSAHSAQEANYLVHTLEAWMQGEPD